MTRRLHAIRSVGSIALEMAFGDDYKAELPQLESEHIATLNVEPHGVEEMLFDFGYEYQVWAARKTHESGVKDWGSYSKVDPDDRSKQWHVHIYPVDAGTAVYSHYEYRVSYPFKHYKSVEYVKGAASPKVKKLGENQ